MLLEQNQFIVKRHIRKSLTGQKMPYEILDGEGIQTLATTVDTTDSWPSFFGSVTLEVREKSDNALVFTLRLSGFLFKKAEVLDPQGQVVGRYKAKILSLSGGFNIYDKEGKHVCQITGAANIAQVRIQVLDSRRQDGNRLGVEHLGWPGRVAALGHGTQL